MKLILIEQESSEWEYMWNWLANHPINEGLEEPSIALNNGEAWQYMGSFGDGENTIHSFRHRCHPKTQNVYNTSVKASGILTEKEVKKSFRL